GVPIGGISATSGFHQPEERTTAPERISTVRQAAQQRRERLLSGERVSSRGGSAETRAAFATRLRELARPRETDAPVRPITSFHVDSRYGGDLHRADMRPSKKKGSKRLPSGCKSKAAGTRWLAELLGITQTNAQIISNNRWPTARF